MSPLNHTARSQTRGLVMHLFSVSTTSAAAKRRWDAYGNNFKRASARGPPNFAAVDRASTSAPAHFTAVRAPDPRPSNTPRPWGGSNRKRSAPHSPLSSTRRTGRPITPSSVEGVKSSPEARVAPSRPSTSRRRGDTPSTAVLWLTKKFHWSSAVNPKELLGGLKYIHSKGIAHQDLKPENVLIPNPLHGEDFDSFSVVIGDLGVAGLSDDTRTTTFEGGSPNWMPPRFMRDPAAPDCSAFNDVDGTSETETSQAPVQTPTPGDTVGMAPQEGAPAQPLSTSRHDTAPESRQPIEVAQTEETHATQRQVAPIQSRGSFSTSAGTTTSMSPKLVPAPSPTATNSAGLGPSTPTLSPPCRLTPEQELPTETHATRLHQVLGEWRLSKQASKSSQPAVNDEASEEAEAKAFLAKYKAVAHPQVKAKPKPRSLPSPSKPKQTKGSASRSLMDAIRQAPAASHPPTQPNPVGTNLLRSSLVVLRSPPMVAGA
ncbi:hypothetical protein M407DRAFT_24404 [Tulasnella calospora MUT 4182]|uniref:Protein kinase domain-containing protein n=1 Tax=Tulasnella calospora MUT 4182 TaxID=1051891 RepID=A0A0C3KY47_9AGAM|nr:hypothetical protein M407DRAFT_24404 [Tulasnella calospora MUT 4182]